MRLVTGVAAGLGEGTRVGNGAVVAAPNVAPPIASARHREQGEPGNDADGHTQ
jgi:hypothetical protein